MKNLTHTSFSAEDCTVLLTDLSDASVEETREKRERGIQLGTSHYSETLLRETLPTETYSIIFEQAIRREGKQVAQLVANCAKKLWDKYGGRFVLVSLARAGTPAGVLVKRYIQQAWGASIPHYTVSIIRDRGLDENAIHTIVEAHPDLPLQFLDGWTGKGTITRELQKACNFWNERYTPAISSDLAVLADPGRCASVSGTERDVLLPHACLNATVTGLLSRTIWNEKFLEPNDYHGVKVYQEWQKYDVTNGYIQEIANWFSAVQPQVTDQVDKMSFKGEYVVNKLQKEWGLPTAHFIKPGIGETTRVLLRRVPWKVLVNNASSPQVQHILQLAKEKQVDVIETDTGHYAAVGLIQPLEGANT